MARENDTALDTLDDIYTIVCTLVEVSQEHTIKKSASTSIPLPMSPLCDREHDEKSSSSTTDNPKIDIDLYKKGQDDST